MQIQEKHLFQKPIKPKSIPPLPAKQPFSKQTDRYDRPHKDESQLSPFSRVHMDQTPPNAPKFMKTEDVSFEEENEDDLFKLSQFLTKRNSSAQEASTA